MTRFSPPQVQDDVGYVYDINPNNIIGTGQYSEVYRTDVRGRQIAIKLVPLYKMSEKQREVFARGIEFIRTQIRYGSVNQNQHIVTYYSEFVDKLNPDVPVHCITMELGAGTLFELGRKFYTPQNILTICSQVVDAIAYLHSNNIMHRDIKLQNFILMSRSPEANIIVKLIDFGFVKEDQGPINQTDLGTGKYKHPKLSRNEPYGKECDIYSLGRLIVNYLEMITSSSNPALASTQFYKELMKIGEEMSSESVGADGLNIWDSRFDRLQSLAKSARNN